MNAKLKRKLLAGTAAALIICASVSCGPSETEFSFVFLTDIHIQPENRGVEGLALAIEKVNELEPDFVLTGGDQIFDAVDQGFQRADLLYNLYLETAQSLTMPLFNTMGNHDHFGLGRDSGVDPEHEEYGKKMFCARQAESRYYSFDHQGWHFMILDSVRFSEGGGYRGGIDAEQMDWISEELDKLEPETPIVLSTHIPFISVSFQLREEPGEYRQRGLVLDNGWEVLSLFQSHNLRLVLQGHLHAFEDITVRGIRFVTGGAVCSNWWEGLYHDLEEGFLMVRIKGESIRCEYIDYGWEAVVVEE